ncbi:MAG: hypothetical protein COY40_04080 [Alphaproteobacteria bacterium CG_4_10_14_0_8_um_filter_53_9]|nr:MAG: hypothetical protein COY40_04080 [Alphaproteobacteria bacterium CG_4_10_14_0_8_um_filter_53_9]
MRTRTIISGWLTAAAATALAGCAAGYTQKNSPANAYKDYDIANKNNAAVIGIGEPMSVRQMRADATFNTQGTNTLESVMKDMATTYNVAIRWGNGVRQNVRKDVVINNLSFDEARAYIEDVYDVQIIREGERRLLVLPSASETRLTEFNPGDNVSLASALKGLADQCGYNLVITESRDKLSSARVSTRLKDVTCFDAFEALLAPQGLSLVNTGDYYTIGGLPQRKWTVNLYEPERDETMTVKYASDIGSGSSSESGGSSGSAGGSSEVKITYTRNLWQDLETDLNRLVQSYCEDNTASSEPSNSSSTGTLLPPPSNVGGSMMPQDNNTMGSTGGAVEGSSSNACGYVRINKNIGMIQMRAPISVLQEAADIIDRTEEIATRRIMLEARVLAVTTSRNYNQDGRIIGLQGDKAFGYNDAATTLGTGQLSSAGNAPASTGAPAMSMASTLASFLDSTGGSGSATSGVGAGGFLGVGNRTLQAAVQFLESYGTTYELMHPRIELMDRQRATLIDGRNEKYFVASTTSDTETNTTESTIEERSQFLGLQFSAAAQVGDKGEPHTISLQIPITSKISEVDIPNSGGSKAPVASTRLIDQQVRLRDGEIKVIGGLTKTIAVDRESGIPIFREIPVAGKLGNQENISYENVEFVVLLQVKQLD